MAWVLESAAGVILAATIVYWIASKASVVSLCFPFNC